MSRLALGRFCFGLLGVVITTRGAEARTFAVNNLGDAVDAAPGDGFCRTAANVCTLRAAIQEANAFAGADRINLTLQGSYALSIGGAGENAAARGDLDVSTVIDIYNMSGGVASIDAGGLAPRDRVFDVLAGALGLHGVGVRDGAGQAFGGCIQNQNARVTLDQVTLTSCSATNDGGGIRSIGAQARVVITGSTITANSAVNGGAIANDLQSTLSVTDTNFTGNTATGSGGAVYNHIAGGGLTGGTLSSNRASRGGAFANIDGVFDLTSTSIDNNTAGTGGGIYQDEPTGAAILVLLLVHATGNQAQNGAGGGGMYAHHGYVEINESDFIANSTTVGPGGGLALDPETDVGMSISQTNVSQNTSTTHGGGIAYFGAGDLIDIFGSTIDNNTANGNGGGIWALEASGGSMLYSTVSTNNARNGGGLWLGGTVSATVSLDDSTIAVNRASVTGGGVYVNTPGTFATYQSIIARSTGGGDCGGPGTLTSNGYTLLQTVGVCLYTSATTDVIGVNPMLGALNLNGGRTPTHAISPASPAYNAGSTSNCGAADQADHAAPAKGRCDIGAYEHP